MPGNEFSGVHFSNISRGSMPPEPPRGDGLKALRKLRTTQKVKENLEVS